MGLIPNEYPQDAVVWEFSDHAADGSLIVKAGKKITVFWPQQENLEINNEQAPISKPVQVMVDREVPVRSLMRLGAKCELPTSPDELMEVIGFTKSPDLKAEEFALSVSLRRYGEALPTVT